MKKFIYENLVSAFSMLATASTVSAQAVFNAPGEMPTVTVTNSSRPCQLGAIDGCWQSSTTARSGEVIAVHIYYHNTSNTPAEGTTLSIKPRTTGTVSSVTFTGGVASLSGPRAVGSAHVSLDRPGTLTYVAGSARWYPTENSGPRAVNESGLFGGSGFNIGTVMPDEQGVLVANFRVSGTATNSGVCGVDSFTADDRTIERGESTGDRWPPPGVDPCDHDPCTEGRK